ncbi:MAG: L-2-amino-thiazoline-4-carboxylic acid hydrolase [Bacteroidota bacterium]
MNSIDNQYVIYLKDVEFSKNSKNPMDKRLDVSSYFLALIKVLTDKGQGFDSIRIIAHEIAYDFVKPKNYLQLLMKKLPVKMLNFWFTPSLLKWFDKKVKTNPHSDGFVANIITDKNDTFGLGYGFDILECGICKLYKKHQFESFAKILCEVDEITTQLAGLQLIRTGTIALGHSKCDFRFKKI